MDYLKYVLRESKIVRFFLLPYMRIKLWIRKQKYQKSTNSEKVKKYHNIHNNEKCFIIGNGPSLRVEDLEALRDVVTFGSNSVFEIYDKTAWRPTYYISVDPTYILTHKEQIEKKVDSIKFISDRVNIDMGAENTEYIFEYNKFKVNKWNDNSAEISEDVSKFFSVGYTVTFTAIQLAIYMGFKEIYLLGIDYNYPVARDTKGRKVFDANVEKVHFYQDSKKDEKYNVFNYVGSLAAYNVAKEYADEHGIKIVNATRGGKLEVFERADFNKVISELKGSR